MTDSISQVKAVDFCLGDFFPIPLSQQGCPNIRTAGQCVCVCFFRCFSSCWKISLPISSFSAALLFRLVNCYINVDLPFPDSDMRLLHMAHGFYSNSFKPFFVDRYVWKVWNNVWVIGRLTIMPNRGPFILVLSHDRVCSVVAWCLYILLLKLESVVLGHHQRAIMCIPLNISPDRQL